MKKPLIIAIMFVLGFGAMFAFAFVVEARIGTPIPGSAKGGDPLAPATAGIVDGIEHARSALARGEQTPAAHALDGAMRAARVAEHAAPERADAALAEAHARIEEARRAIQNGRNEKAETKLRDALTTLREETPARAARPATPSGTELARYRGATLIDPMGVRIGEVVAIRPEAQEAIVRRGGMTDVFGFWDIDGQETAVPLDRLLFGAPRGLGSTLVMATEEGA